jgi:lysophospholipase L1-like esterase
MPRLWPDLPTVALAPLMWWQGRQLRARIPILDVASDSHAGTWPGTGRPYTLLTLGESPLASFGLRSHRDGLAARLAWRLSGATGQPVHWHTLGYVGATLADLIAHADEFPEVRPDLLIVGMGVNDAKGLVRRRTWIAGWTTLLQILRRRYGEVPLLVSDIPPLGQFPALPPLLARTLGRRASLLQISLDTWVEGTHGVWRAPLTVGFRPSLFCEDGFDPSADGQDAWAEGIWPITQELLKAPTTALEAR